ncbi:MAG: hypothetical protein B7Z14_16455 [Bosea sp. 32-68-6]|nr:MAG: hypothetical protein B7Z14_16455 [Bosea sp. 32-68-6]
MRQAVIFDDDQLFMQAKGPLQGRGDGFAAALLFVQKTSLQLTGPLDAGQHMLPHTRATWIVSRTICGDEQDLWTRMSQCRHDTGGWPEATVNQQKYRNVVWNA